MDLKSETQKTTSLVLTLPPSRPTAATSGASSSSQVAWHGHPVASCSKNFPEVMLFEELVTTNDTNVAVDTDAAVDTAEADDSDESDDFVEVDDIDEATWMKIIDEGHLAYHNNVPVDRSLNIPVGGSLNILADGSLNIPVGGSLNIPVGGSLNIPADESLNIPAGGSLNIPADGSLNIPVDGSRNDTDEADDSDGSDDFVEADDSDESDDTDEAVDTRLASLQPSGHLASHNNVPVGRSRIIPAGGSRNVPAVRPQQAVRLPTARRAPLAGRQPPSIERPIAGNQPVANRSNRRQRRFTGIPARSRPVQRTRRERRRSRRPFRDNVSPESRAVAAALMSIVERRNELQDARLRNDRRKVEVQHEHNQILSRIADVAEAWVQVIKNREAAKNKP